VSFLYVLPPPYRNSTIGYRSCYGADSNKKAAVPTTRYIRIVQVVVRNDLSEVTSSTRGDARDQVCFAQTKANNWADETRFFGPDGLIPPIVRHDDFIIDRLLITICSM